MAAACSPDCRYYAALSEDGRLKIWQTETNTLLQEYTPDLHLSAPPVCLTWIVLNTGSPTKKAKKRKSSGPDINREERNDASYVALGTTSGKVLIYSVALAKVETVLTESSNQQIKDNTITSLDWDRDYGLYSCTSDNNVYEWDISGATVRNRYNIGLNVKNKGNKVTAIKIIPHNLNKHSRYIVTASCQLQLWSLTPQSLLRTMIGHSGAVSALARAHFTNNKCYVISCTKTERILSFWDVTVTADDTKLTNGGTPSKRQHQNSATEAVITPAYNFLLEDAPTCVDVSVRETDGAFGVNIGAVTRSGVVHYYGHVLNGSSTKPIKPSLTLQVATEDAKPMPLQCCRFVEQGERDAGEMLVGYEVTPGRIWYERVIPETKNKTQVLIRKGPSTKDKKASGARGGDTRADDAAPTSVTYAETSGPVRKRISPGSKVEIPLESRLTNLALDTSRKDSAVNQNLTRLLVQGLHSNDKALTLTVLQREDPAVADRTVASLPPRYIPALVEQLADMASKKTSQCRAMNIWLKALLYNHSAILLATLNTPATGEKFSRLLAIIKQRTSHMSRLIDLKGRLDLMMAERSKKDQQHITSKAVIEYFDTSSDEDSDVEMEVGGEESSNSVDWEDESLREDEDKEDEEKDDDRDDDSLE